MTVYSQNSKPASDQVSERGSEPALEPVKACDMSPLALAILRATYEQAMFETESSHIWHLKNE